MPTPHSLGSFLLGAGLLAGAIVLCGADSPDELGPGLAQDAIHQVLFWPGDRDTVNRASTSRAPIRLDRRTGATWSYCEDEGHPAWRRSHTKLPLGSYRIAFWPEVGVEGAVNLPGTTYAPMLLNELTGATWIYDWSGQRIVWHPVRELAQ